ncbi:hypothetical protein [Streptomyces collinus]|uniref:hypothetical protein n=1 Tax=Streptomyces collinus TaxID=42684 RepID=UPI003EBD3ECB
MKPAHPDGRTTVVLITHSRVGDEDARAFGQPPQQCEGAQEFCTPEMTCCAPAANSAPSAAT